MKALRLENATVREIDIENKLEALQKEVEGYIEVLTLIPDEVVMIVNEEGRLRGMGVNPYASCLYGEPIVGVAVVVGVDGEEFCDVPERYLRRFGV